jgi:hypothetical protein
MARRKMMILWPKPIVTPAATVAAAKKTFTGRPRWRSRRLAHDLITTCTLQVS